MRETLGESHLERIVIGPTRRAALVDRAERSDGTRYAHRAAGARKRCGRAELSAADGAEYAIGCQCGDVGRHARTDDGVRTRERLVDVDRTEQVAPPGSDVSYVDHARSGELMLDSNVPLGRPVRQVTRGNVVEAGGGGRGYGGCILLRNERRQSDHARGQVGSTVRIRQVLWRT